jgi:hypothetical protein
MDRLFDIGVTGDRTCRTCVHSVQRHGNPSRRAYPLVCLLKAQAVPMEYGDGSGTGRFDYPCGIGMEGDEWYPRGWAQR